MRLTALALGSAALLLAPDAATAQEASRAPQATQAAADAGQEKAEEEPRICKRVAISGTRVRTRRECRTRKDWDAIAHLAAEDLEANRRPTNLEREAP